MARPDKLNKRDNEKKKQQKRQEKQKKKEERKLSGKTNSFEEMIAYVDENGMITSTPPEMQNRKVNQEEILISTPKKEKEIPEDRRGNVDYFDSSRGYGFIKEIPGENKYFFHRSNAPEDIGEGDKVFFDLERGQKGMNAVNVRLEKE